MPVGYANRRTLRRQQLLDEKTDRGEPDDLPDVDCELVVVSRDLNFTSGRDWSAPPTASAESNFAEPARNVAGRAIPLGAFRRKDTLALAERDSEIVEDVGVVAAVDDVEAHRASVLAAKAIHQLAVLPAVWAAPR